MTRCQEVLKHLYEYLNAHDLSGEAVKTIRRHLEKCRPCFSRYEFERLLMERIKKAGCCPCPDSLKKKIRTLLKIY